MNDAARTYEAAHNPGTVPESEFEQQVRAALRQARAVASCCDEHFDEAVVARARVMHIERAVAFEVAARERENLAHAAGYARGIHARTRALRVVGGA